MTLLWTEGFDTQQAGVPGAYNFANIGMPERVAYYTGRKQGYSFGTAGTGANYGAQLWRQIPSQTEVIIGFAIRPGGGTNYNHVVSTFLLNGTVVAVISYDHSTGEIVLRRGANNVNHGNAPIIASAGTIVNDSVTWTYVELRLKCGTTTGEAQFAINGELQSTVTGLNTGSATINGVGFGSNSLSSPSPNYGSNIRLDDIYVLNKAGTTNNDFLGDVQVVGLLPNGPGTTTGLTPTTAPNWDAVDEVPPNTTDYNYSDVPGTLDTYNYQDLAIPGSIKAVNVRSYAAKSDTGQVSGRALAKLGPDTATGNDITLSTSYTLSDAVFETTPLGDPWTVTHVNDAEFGWEVRA